MFWGGPWFRENYFEKRECWRWDNTWWDCKVYILNSFQVSFHCNCDRLSWSKKYRSRNKDTLSSTKTEIEEKLLILVTLWVGGTLWEHPVPSTSGITSVGTTKHLSAHEHDWIILDTFCDTSCGAFCQKNKSENTS